MKFRRIYMFLFLNLCEKKQFCENDIKWLQRMWNTREEQRIDIGPMRVTDTEKQKNK